MSKQQKVRNEHLHILEITAEALQRNDVSLENSDECIDAVLEKEDMSKEDKEFIRRLYDGCITFKRVLKRIAMRFCAEHSVKRRESSLYMVLLYLAMCEIDDLTPNTFEKFMLALAPPRITPLLMCIFDKEAIEEGWIRDILFTSYDEDIAREQFIAPMLSHLESVHKLVASMNNAESLTILEDTLYGKNKDMTAFNSDTFWEKPKQQTTVLQPFNLTQPKPRKVVVKKEVVQTDLFKTNPIPDSTYRSPLEQEALERQKRVNKDKAEKKVRDLEKTAFSCAPSGAEMMNKHRKRAEQKSRQEQRQLKTAREARPVPASIHKHVPIKLNSAAILREEKLHRSKLEDEAARLARLEAGEFNEEELRELEEQVRLEEEDQRMADIERKVLEGQLSHEEAILAKQQAMEKRIDMALSLKQKQKTLLRRAKEVQQKKAEERRQRAEEIALGREQAGLAVERVQQEKIEQGMKVKEEEKRLREMREEQEREDMERKLELIREIQALESVRAERGTIFDATEMQDHGMLHEMSYAELQQRLDMQRKVQEHEQQLKRDAIFEAKLAHDMMMKEKLAAIERGRAHLGQQRQAKSSMSSLASTRKSTAGKNDPKVSELRKKLAAKRAERLEKSSRAGSTLTSRQGSRGGGKNAQ
eukprot:m.100898 g.100898  ORF g.100898 m.100898 type:complete len:645 (+) comp9053_c1_seq1:34-1968(+)